MNPYTPVLWKQPSESRYYDIDCSSVLQSDETITSIVSIAQSTAATPAPGPLTITEQSIWISGKGLQMRIAGGDASIGYLITAKFSTNKTESIEIEVRLLVADRT